MPSPTRWPTARRSGTRQRAPKRGMTSRRTLALVRTCGCATPIRPMCSWAPTTRSTAVAPRHCQGRRRRRGRRPDRRRVRRGDPGADRRRRARRLDLVRLATADQRRGSPADDRRSDAAAFSIPSRSPASPVPALPMPAPCRRGRPSARASPRSRSRSGSASRTRRRPPKSPRRRSRGRRLRARRSLGAQPRSRGHGQPGLVDAVLADIRALAAGVRRTESLPTRQFRYLDEWDSSTG